MTLWNSKVSADIEPAQIFIEKGKWVDPGRNDRQIPYKIYKPSDEISDTLPVIVWSHGLGGSRDGAGFISRFVASYGYIVVHIQHVGTDSTLWEGKPGHPWDIIRSMQIPRKATLQRLRDVPFALDRVTEIPDPRLDMGRLGFCGHSFGAMTTQIAAGQYRGTGRRRYQLRDQRVKAGILYSPGPAQDVSQYEGIDIPLLAMTGTADDSPLREFGQKEREKVYAYAGGPEQHLLVLADGDHMVFNGSRGQLGENPKRAIHEKIIKVLSLAFWDAYLKKDEDAYAWLTGDGVRAWLGTEADYSYRRA